MKLNILLWMVLPISHMIGQNLVPNPGFDDITNCPNNIGQITFAIPWVSATNGTPDIYNECSTNANLMVPNAGIYPDSYQIQKSGGGYAGIWVFSKATPYHGLSEYLETQLNEELIRDKQYYVRFYVSPDITYSQSDWTYQDAIGAAFSNSFYYNELQDTEILHIEPVIENLGSLISDTLSWTKISGCYVAQGGEKYVIIGNFRAESEMQIQTTNYNSPFYSSYFYIEDVLIQAFDPLPDTLLLCDGQPEALNAAFLDATYYWSTGETDSTLLIQTSGIYSVEVFIDDCVLRDTVVVLDTKETGGFQSDTTICADEPITLAAPLPGSYLWSDGSSSRELEVSSTGSYAVTVTNGCGQFAFSTQVEAVDCACNIYVPTAISPNGDGINDELRPYFGCDYEYRTLRFAVFDRWGGEVYTSGEGEAPVWDGSARGKPVVPGTYVWFLEYETQRNGTTERHLEKGEVNVIR